MYLFLEQTNAEVDFSLGCLTGFIVTCPVTLLSSLALLRVLVRSLQLTVNENES